MVPPTNKLCVVLLLALANRLVDAFLFSTCEITACDLREKVSTIKDTLDSHTGQMSKLVDLQHMVDKMKRGMYYQQQQIESLQKKLEDAAGTTRNTRDGDLNLGRTLDVVPESLTSYKLDAKYIDIIKRLDRETTNLTSQVGLLWRQNKALAQELTTERRRSEALLRKMGEHSNISDAGTTLLKFEKLVQPKNISNQLSTQDSIDNSIDARNAYKDQDLLDLNNSLLTSKYENIASDSSKGTQRKSSASTKDSKQAPPDFIILKTEQRLKDIEHKLLGLDESLNTSHLGNSIENLSNKSEIHKYEIDNVQQQVERVTKMSMVLNNKVNFMNRCLVNLTEHMAKLTAAENFSKVDIIDEIKDLQDQMSIIEDLKNDVFALKNGSIGSLPLGKLKTADNDTSDYIEPTKLRVIDSVMKEMGDVYNRTSDRSEVGDGLNSSTQRDSTLPVEWLKNSTLNRDEVIKMLKELLEDGQEKSIPERMNAFESTLMAINSTTVMQLTEVNKEIEHILNMIVKHVVREQIKEGDSKEVEQTPEVSKLIDVIEVTGDEDSTVYPGRTFTVTDHETDNATLLIASGEKPLSPSRKGLKRRNTQSGSERESEWLQPRKNPCHLKPPTDENVMAYFNGDIIQDFRNTIPSGQTVYFRCENIGEYKLLGERRIICDDGRWQMETHIPICEKTITEQKIIEMMENSQKKELFCPESTGSFPHPRDCSAYLECTDWQVEIARCLPPFKFNAEKGACDWESSVDCSSRDQPENIDKNFAKLEPSILIHPVPGSAGVTISQSSQLYVYPGTTFELHCLFPKKYGTPNWVAQIKLNPLSNDRIDYSTFWVKRNGNTDGSLRYALRVDFSQEKDSGNYTCILPSGAAKTVEVVVKAVKNVRKFVYLEHLITNKEKGMFTELRISRDVGKLHQCSQRQEHNNKNEKEANGSVYMVKGGWTRKPTLDGAEEECYRFQYSSTEIDGIVRTMALSNFVE
ncbi:hypothetical protein GQR58_020268 [Nymphon striatum]|nr:hypothetical protein GQR58_020268 [Nymphon striatum]